ncbi:unnamed protein product [Soboliphyme baturini]|uniref:Decapping nuclease n=1 Tax=Soboliphyme baturini TaxID=241478 RepID=A0A3P8B2Z2_9BILA|nr:unnamed protein product [Soboliphyme baturini]
MNGISISFCQLQNEEIERSKKNLRIYVSPTAEYGTAIDLNKGYEQFVNRGASYSIEPLLKWVRSVREEKKSSGEPGSDFLCWRGLLSRIAGSPYERSDGWMFAVVRVCDVYLLCEFATAEKLLEEQSMSERERRMCYWGYSFETQVTGTNDGSASDRSSQPVQTGEQYCSVIITRLDTNRLLYGCEVDCIDRDSREYVELKVCLRTTFLHRFRKWWLQCFLGGIRTLVCGYRSDQGIIQTIKTIPVDDLPRLAREFWSATVLFNFLSRVLQFVRETVIENDATAVYVFHWNPRMATVGFYRSDDSQFDFLPDWFRSEFVL